MGSSRRKPTRVRGGGGYGISRGIREIAKGISKGNQEKIMWNFKGFWWLGLGIPKESNAILWNFQGWSFVLSGISRGKVKKLKNSRGSSKKYVCSQPPAVFFSGIAQSMISNEFKNNQIE